MPDIDNYRLKRLLARKLEQEQPRIIIPICRGFHHSTSFVWDFSVCEPTKTCRECGFIDNAAAVNKREAA